MDKNKNRTDLLAAGRKKLQQYRQKKDKGSTSHGKTSKKSGKTEQLEVDADATSTAVPSTASFQVPEEDIAPHVDSDAGVADSSLSHSTYNSEALEKDIATINQLTVPNTLETGIDKTLLAHNAVTQPQESDVGDQDVDVPVTSEVEIPQTVDAEATRVFASGTFELLNSEGEKADVNMSKTFDKSTPVSIDATEKFHQMETFPSREDVPDMLMIQASGDQVSDEAYSLGLKDSDRSSEQKFEEARVPTSSELGSDAEMPAKAASGGTDVDDVIPEAKKMEEAYDIDVSSFGGANIMSHGFSASVSTGPEVDGVLIDNLEVANQQREERMINSSNDENPNVHTVSDDCGNRGKDVDQAGIEDTTIAKFSYQGHLPEGCSMANDRVLLEEKLASSSGGWTKSPVADVSSINLSQLVEIINGLNEDEYQFLLKEKEVSGMGLGTGVYSHIGLSVLLERLKEELYLTNFTKDIFCRQLTEQHELQLEFDNKYHQLVDEVFLLNASLSEYRGRNESLVEELAQCRSELEAVAITTKDFENQLHTAKAETEESSVRASELQIILERSQGDMLTLSMELDACKNFVAALQVEKENLDGSLASVTDEIKKLEEEKKVYLRENEKLLTELSDHKSLLAALQVENFNFSGTLASLTEERKKIEEEKVYVIHENEKLLMELAEFKGLMSALQVENANVKGTSDLVMAEKKKLEEEKEYFVHEHDRLSDQLLVLQEQLSKKHTEWMQVEVELKEATVRLEQLAKENVCLKSSLDIHKVKMREIDGRPIQLQSADGEAENQVEGAEVQSRGHENSSDDIDFYSISGNRDGEVSFPVLQKTLSEDGLTGGLPHELHDSEVFDDSLGFGVLKGHLEDAEKILQKLEKEIEGMHSHSVSLSRSGGKVPAPGVSKLIQAFESKVHLDEHEVEERAVTEDQSPEDHFTLTKEQTGNLRTLLKQLGLDAENANAVFKGERDGRKTVNVMVTKLKVQFEALEEHSNNLEAANVEVGVLYEAVKQHVLDAEAKNSELEALNEALKQHVCDIEAKNSELEILQEALKEQDISLKAENSELAKKLNEYLLRYNELENQLSELQRSSDEMASKFSIQLESVQNEAAERISDLNQEWSSSIAEIVEIVQKLDDSVGRGYALTLGSHDGVDINNRAAASVDAAIKAFEDLHQKLESAYSDHEVKSNVYKEVDEQLNNMRGMNELSTAMLRKMHHDLNNLIIHSCGSMEGREMNIQKEDLLDPLDPTNYEALLEKLRNIVVDRLQLVSVNNSLNSELMSKTKDIEKLQRRCLDSDAIDKLIEDVEGIMKLEDAATDLDKSLSSQLESLVSFLVRKYKEADEHVGLSRKEYESKVVELTELQEKIQQLSFQNVQLEKEIIILNESLSQAEEALSSARSEFMEKASELEQSEQRVASIREKLSIAVAKGKGLVVQRDSLKQSLAETSNEMERCSQELQSKDVKIHELETKLKTYSEAGERVEALESELSYIRNSATALRESFLLKDSVLQGIEEIIEDLDLPEHFHSRDIIEKVNWLARSATGNSLPLTDWDQKSSAGGGSYSDAGLVAMDPWKEDAHLNSNSGDDVRRKFDELQNKFYGLAEQNEMLEQSLMERNNLVQRWEELLDGIDMPLHLRSVEPEDRIEWLSNALSEAHHDRHSFEQKVDNLESYCGSMAADLEESQSRISNLEAELQSVLNERDHLSERLNILTRDYEKLSAKGAELELVNEKLRNEVTLVQEKLVEKLGNEERIYSIESEIGRMQNLIFDALQDPGREDLVSDGGSTEYLEMLLRKLLERHASLSAVKPLLGDEALNTVKDDATLNKEITRDTLYSDDPDVAVLKKELEEASNELMYVKEERDGYVKKQQLLVYEVEALDKKREELQELLNQEEQKSASVREKLNVAVRKGKSLVQQRDSLKQTIEERNSDVEQLKSVIKHQENTLAEYEEKIRDLSAYPGRIEALESEILFLRNHITETERHLQDNRHALSKIVNTLGDIDIGGEVDLSDPVKKLEQIGKLCLDLRTSIASSEQESRKSKRAAELLLAELNEVQERNDGLQDELAKATTELRELSKEKDLAETAKLEALSCLEKFSSKCSEERDRQLSELTSLNSDVNQLRKDFLEVNNILADFFSKNLEFLHNLEDGMELCLRPGHATAKVGVPSFLETGNKKDNFSVNFWSDAKWKGHSNENSVTDVCSSVRHHLQNFMTEISALKDKLQKHSISLHEQADSLAKVVEIVYKESISQKESCEAMKKNILQIKSVEQEIAMENDVLRRNIGLLYEACSGSVMEIDNIKAELEGNNIGAGYLEMNAKSATFVDRGLSEQTNFSSEECVKTMADKLLLAVKDFGSMKAHMTENNQKEMKITIGNLQKELHEKDIQKERICMELVSQIKEAEAVATSYKLELQSSKAQMHDLDKRVEVMEEERNLLEQRVKELQDGQANSKELEERVRLLTDRLAAKDQEIDSLMQALDEEEVQMECLMNKIEELEKVVQQKNLDMENLEASRGKIAKKLSVTVNKFDELHHLSASLLAEIEKLQSQIQDREAEISFLRQEVTRCTNDVLVASQTSNKRNSDEINEFLMWIHTIISQLGFHDVEFNSNESNEVLDYKEILQEKITIIISELEELRLEAQSRDALLHVERSKVEELMRKGEALEKSLREKESQLNLLEGPGDSRHATGTTSEIFEAEPVISKWTVSGPSVAPQVRSLRKVNNDQVAISIESDPGSSSRLEDEDDDKVHGFKSLTTSRIVPKFTRPVTDMVDGLWVSCDRALMRQPALRLGIILYWAILHALLATFAV